MNLPGKIGIGIRPFSVRRANLSSLTGVFKGASLSFQSGNNSSKALGSRQAPDNVWPPNSEVRIKWISL